jgi:hypothetical protein
MNSIPRIWGGPGNGEACDACELIVTKDGLIIEGISLAAGRKPLQLHVECSVGAADGALGPPRPTARVCTLTPPDPSWRPWPAQLSASARPRPGSS